MSSLSNMQREICLKFGASCLQSDGRLKMGISRMFDPEQFPVNGLRYPRVVSRDTTYPLEGDATGWYIWSGEELPIDDDAFVPLCAFHLNDKCPEIVKYFGLGPGWRFLLAPGYEDVWYDENLLDLTK
jgi:hypothetical protein